MRQLLNFIASRLGHNADNLEESRRRRLFAIFAMFIIIPMVLLGIQQLSYGFYGYGIVDLIVAVVLIGFLISSIFLKNGKPIYRLSIIILVGLFVYWIPTGAVQGYASLWALAFPPYAFYLMGKREGLAWTVLVAILITLLFVNPYRMLPAFQYPPQFISRHLLTYIMISILIYNYESVRVRYLAAIRAEGEKLLREKERIEEVVTARTFEIKEKSRKLEERERRYRLLADNVNDLIWSTDLDLKFTFISPSITSIYGYSLEEGMNLTVNKVHTPESMEKMTAVYREEMEAERAGNRDPDRHRILELEQVKKDGTVFAVESKVSFVRDDDGRAIGFVGVTRDITERRQAQLEKEKIQEQLAQMQKMEALGTLVGGIAHDFNNILGGIVGYTELALNNIKDSSTKKMLEQVLKAGDRATDLVRQILSFSRIQKGEVKPISPVSITKEVLKLMRATLPSTIEIKHDINSESYIQADAINIHQVLMNLCTNAAHAMKQKGGVLSASLQDVTLGQDDLLHRPDMLPGEYIRISIEDTGIGMTTDIQKRAFDPFFTTKGLGEGTGMGLATVHGIVTGLSGFVSLYSEPNQGTAIYVFIPIIPKPAVVEGRPANEPLHGGTERILFVDDEQVLIDLAKEALSHYGYHVTAFSDSTIALAHFLQHPDKYDLVVTDMTMPKMTGDELTQKIHLKRPDIPAIMCTGFSEDMDEQNAESLGIDAFLYKPIIFTKLLGTIRKILDQKG